MVSLHPSHMPRLAVSNALPKPDRALVHFGQREKHPLPDLARPAHSGSLWITGAFWTGLLGIFGNILTAIAVPGYYKWSDVRQDHYTVQVAEASLRPEQVEEMTLKFAHNPNFKWTYGYYKGIGKTYTLYAPGETEDHYRDKVSKDIVLMLQHRPDLLRKLMAQSMTFQLVDGESYALSRSPGINAIDPDRKTLNAVGHQHSINHELGLCLSSIDSSLDNPNDGSETVRHEVTHWIESMDELGQPISYDGLLPGWNSEEIERFKTLRQKEIEAIKAEESILGSYALDNNDEFIAVLAETYFECPEKLQETSPGLYAMMDEYFTHPTETRQYTRYPSSYALAYGTGIILSLPGVFCILRDMRYSRRRRRL